MEGAKGAFSKQPAANKPTAKGKKQPKCKGIKGSRAKKKTWGEETAGAKTNVGVGVGRGVAVPVGGAAAMGTEDPGAAAPQPEELLLIPFQR